jgi:hypothetical protein
MLKISRLNVFLLCIMPNPRWKKIIKKISKNVNQMSLHFIITGTLQRLSFRFLFAYVQKYVIAKLK